MVSLREIIELGYFFPLTCLNCTKRNLLSTIDCYYTGCLYGLFFFLVHQFSSVTQPCPTLCNPMNRSTPGPPVHHHLLEFIQTHIHRAISFSVVPFSSCPQSLPASESFPMSQLFAGGGQSTGASALASFLPKKSQG